MSETTKHTPGPWDTGVYNDDATLHGWLYRINLGRPATDIEAQANARLIAAAPDLLAVVEELLRIPADEPGRVVCLVPAARAAIAKARGE